MIILRRADMSDKDIARFWAKVDRSGDCWIWQAAAARGYGQIGFHWKVVRAHRFAYALAHGECANDLEIDHMCHNRRCVNPAHLQPVTHQQNCGNKGADKRNKSGIRGVNWNPKANKWQVRATVRGKSYSGGYYFDIHEAEKAAIALRDKLMANNRLDSGKRE